MDWPSNAESQRVRTRATDLEGVQGRKITAGSTPHTKGAYRQLVGSDSPLESHNLTLMLQDAPGSAATNFLVDLAFGDIDQEVVVIPNILLSVGAASARSCHAINIPFRIPAFTRVSARCQASIPQYPTGVYPTTDPPSVLVSVFQMSGSLMSLDGFSRCVAYGINLPTTASTAIDPLTVNNTYGPWFQLTPACEKIRGLLVAIGGNYVFTRPAMRWLFQIGIGPVGSVVQIGPSILLAVSPNEYMIRPSYIYMPFAVSSGNAIFARGQSMDCSDNLLRQFDISLYGLN